MNNRMNDLLSRIQRELPDTDKTRYDAAYERGKAQARSGLLVGGLALGALIGAVLMFLFEPNRGPGRRAQLAQRASGLRNDLARSANGRVHDPSGPVMETKTEPGSREREEAVPAAAARTPGRRSKASNGTPVAAPPVEDDWEAAEREAQRASEGHAAG